MKAEPVAGPLLPCRLSSRKAAPEAMVSHAPRTGEKRWGTVKPETAFLE